MLQTKTATYLVCINFFLFVADQLNGQNNAWWSSYNGQRGNVSCLAIFGNDNFAIDPAQNADDSNDVWNLQFKCFGDSDMRVANLLKPLHHHHCFRRTPQNQAAVFWRVDWNFLHVFSQTNTVESNRPSDTGLIKDVCVVAPHTNFALRKWISKRDISSHEAAPVGLWAFFYNVGLRGLDFVTIGSTPMITAISLRLLLNLSLAIDSMSQVRMSSLALRRHTPSYLATCVLTLWMLLVIYNIWFTSKHQDGTCWVNVVSDSIRSDCCSHRCVTWYCHSCKCWSEKRMFARKRLHLYSSLITSNIKQECDCVLWLVNCFTMCTGFQQLQHDL